MVRFEVYKLVLNVPHRHETPHLAPYPVERTPSDHVGVFVGVGRLCEGESVVEVDLVSDFVHFIN